MIEIIDGRLRIRSSAGRRGARRHIRQIPCVSGTDIQMTEPNVKGSNALKWVASLPTLS
jgi:hypothetical protein